MAHPVTVWGGGALGMLLSARLALSGHNVRLWTRTDAQAKLIQERGVELEAPDASKVAVRLTAAPFADAGQGNHAEWVLVALKQTALTENMLHQMARTFSRDAVLVLFQNGIGHLERLAAALPGRTLLAAVTTEGALRTGEAAVRHTGEGETWIGVWPGEADTRAEEALRQTKQMMEKAGFSAFLSNDIRKRVLRKLLMNAVINPLTALWRVPNGELPATSERIAAMQALFRETASILRRFGGLQEHTDEELWAAVLGVCAATAANRSSMLQDVLAGRRTEIDAINGEIHRMAAAIGMSAPWNEAVTTLVKAIQ